MPVRNHTYGLHIIGEIGDLLINVARGRYDLIRPPVLSDPKGEPDWAESVQSGLYMMAEELKVRTISRSYFDHLFNSYLDACFILSKEGIIEEANQAAGKLLCCTREQLVKIHFNTLVVEKGLFPAVLCPRKGAQRTELISPVINFVSPHGVVMPRQALLSWMPTGWGDIKECLLIARMLPTQESATDEGKDNKKTRRNVEVGKPGVQGEKPDFFSLGEVPALSGRITLPSRKEREVLELVSQGYTSEEIAGIRKVDLRTIETQRNSLIDKLGARNVAHLVQIANDLGLIGKRV
ncbi:LuxR C-terminal-related transcriptional regulator [Dinghuibacter silviterrae]|uniref:DNA-binding CsgD family transcriptional regulator n=1 Tax=Dinghuibacter silviterrae TaxID=1539049 RepID=A0A4R8DJA0_9BACT|nr:LuxR C-terminal-related transcriptional regulator [Dinghuibacter silviterrae]TDW97080.1 DNA-binding CsgD family transcriptional regulator [Dinghuibacter silviterrae]